MIYIEKNISTQEKVFHRVISFPGSKLQKIVNEMATLIPTAATLNLLEENQVPLAINHNVFFETPLDLNMELFQIIYYLK